MSVAPFTDRARKVMILAYQEAKRRRSESVESGHLLLGLIEEGNGVAAHLLKSLGVDFGSARREVDNLLAAAGTGTTALGRLSYASDAKKVLRRSREEGRDLRSNYIGTEHILLGLLQDGDGTAGQALRNLGLDLSTVQAETRRFLGAPAASVKRHRPLPPHISVGPLGRFILGFLSFLSSAAFAAFAGLLATAILRNVAAPAPLWAVVLRHVALDLFAIASIFMLLLAMSFWAGGSRRADPLLRKMMPKAVLAIGAILIAIFVIVAVAIPGLRIVCVAEIAVIIALPIVFLIKWRVRTQHDQDDQSA
jgi:hypothetical protein